MHPEVPGSAARHVPARACPSGRSSGCARAARRCRSRSTCWRSSATGSARPAAYHHTAPILAIYALHEALRAALEEGLEARWARHAEAGAHLQRGLRDRGLELLADPAVQLAPLTAVRVPEGVDGKAVQGRLLREHGIEIGGGLGPAAPAMWRIGLMGRNATVETADRVLGALDTALTEEPALAGAAS